MDRVRVIIDADILSTFAKANSLELLGALLGLDSIAMTPAIRDEISVPLQYGYEFPEKVLNYVPVVRLTEKAWEEHERLVKTGLPLGKGELEAMAFCKAEGAIFATNDSVARAFAKQMGVKVLSLQAILRGLWVNGLLDKAEVRKLLDRFRDVDGLEVSPDAEAEIFL